MRPSMPLALALAAALVTAPAAARAQDTVHKESRGEVATKPTAASLVSAIDATVLTTDQLKKLDSIQADQVRIVETSAVVTPSDQKSFDDALERNKGFLGALRAAIRDKATLTKALDNHSPKFTADDVVAAEVGLGNQITLYVRHGM